MVYIENIKYETLWMRPNKNRYYCTCTHTKYILFLLLLLLFVDFFVSIFNLLVLM